MLNKLAYSQCVWYGCSFRLAPFEMFSYKANKYPTSTFWFLAPHCLRVVDSLSSPPDGSINRIPCELCHWRSLGKGKSGKCRTTELRQSTENYPLRPALSNLWHCNLSLYKSVKRASVESKLEAHIKHSNFLSFLMYSGHLKWTRKDGQSRVAWKSNSLR